MVKINFALQKTSKIILGIDPGTVVMGYAIIKIQAGKIELLGMDVLKMSSKDDTYERLQKIYAHVIAVIKKFKPDEFAIEAPFFGKNVQSMLKLGRAQGVAIAAAMQYGLSVTEYSPKKIKQSITGNGNASKEQLMKMLEHIISFTNQSKYFDATDALGVAVCHHFQQKSPVNAVVKNAKGWEDFISRNPQRVK